jgi:hypothetical protein
MTRHGAEEPCAGWVVKPELRPALPRRRRYGRLDGRHSDYPWTRPVMTADEVLFPAGPSCNGGSRHHRWPSRWSGSTTMPATPSPASQISDRWVVVPKRDIACSVIGATLTGAPVDTICNHRSSLHIAKIRPTATPGFTAGSVSSRLIRVRPANPRTAIHSFIFRLLTDSCALGPVMAGACPRPAEPDARPGEGREPCGATRHPQRRPVSPWRAPGPDAAPALLTKEPR